MRNTPYLESIILVSDGLQTLFILGFKDHPFRNFLLRLRHHGQMTRGKISKFNSKVFLVEIICEKGRIPFTLLYLVLIEDSEEILSRG